MLYSNLYYMTCLILIRIASLSCLTCGALRQPRVASTAASAAASSDHRASAEPTEVRCSLHAYRAYSSSSSADSNRRRASSRDSGPRADIAFTAWSMPHPLPHLAAARSTPLLFI